MSLLQSYDGRYLRLEDKIYKVLGKEAGKPSILIESGSGDRLALPASDFRTHVSMGNVSDAMEPEFGSRIRTNAETAEMDFRRDVLELTATYRNEGYSWASALEQVEERFQWEGRHKNLPRQFPKVRTVQLWRNQFMRKGSKALCDQRDLSGNRADRHDRIFEEIVFDLLEQYYLTSDRMTIKRLCDLATGLYKKQCTEEDIHPAPHGRKVVETLLASLPHDDVIKARLGSKEGRKRLIQAGRFQAIRAPFDRIEIDSTIADIFVIIGESGELARPYVTAAIDAATGIIVGLTITLKSPTGVTTAVTLRETMTITPEKFFDMYGIENRFQAHGNPLTVLADQGPENKGEILRRLISSTGIESQLAIPGHPEKKPFIERFFKTFSDFVTQLPGATQTSEIPAKQRTKVAKAEAHISFDDFVRDVQRWRFDIYAKLPRRRIQSVFRTRESPIEVWKRLEQDYFIPEPPSLQDLRDKFYSKKVSRQLHRYGVEVNGIQYSSEQLRYLKKSANVSQVDVWLDPTDIRVIAVINPMSNEAIYVPAKDPDMPAISSEELTRIRKTMKPDVRDEITAKAVLAALIGRYHRKPAGASTPGRKVVEKARAANRDREIHNNSLKKIGVDDSFAENAAVPSIPVSRPKTMAKMTTRKSSE